MAYPCSNAFLFSYSVTFSLLVLQLPFRCHYNQIRSLVSAIVTQLAYPNPARTIHLRTRVRHLEIGLVLTTNKDSEDDAIPIQHMHRLIRLIMHPSPHFSVVTVVQHQDPRQPNEEGERFYYLKQFTIIIRGAIADIIRTVFLRTDPQQGLRNLTVLFDP